jgi:hypothetical protein
MDELVGRVAGVLEAAHKVHGVVAERTGGVDEDWALFYAWWLARWSELPEILPRLPGIAGLTAELVRLDADHRATASAAPWAEHYALALVKGFGG